MDAQANEAFGSGTYVKMNALANGLEGTLEVGDRGETKRLMRTTSFEVTKIPTTLTLTASNADVRGTKVRVLGPKGKFKDFNFSKGNQHQITLTESGRFEILFEPGKTKKGNLDDAQLHVKVDTSEAVEDPTKDLELVAYSTPPENAENHVTTKMYSDGIQRSKLEIGDDKLAHGKAWKSPNRRQAMTTFSLAAPRMLNLDFTGVDSKKTFATIKYPSGRTEKIRPNSFNAINSFPLEEKGPYEIRFETGPERNLDNATLNVELSEPPKGQDGAPIPIATLSSTKRFVDFMIPSASLERPREITFQFTRAKAYALLYKEPMSNNPEIIRPNSDLKTPTPFKITNPGSYVVFFYQQNFLDFLNDNDDDTVEVRALSHPLPTYESKEIPVASKDSETKSTT